MEFDMKQMMEQAKEMQAKMAKKQEELARQTFEATSGGGMVKATVNGKHEILSLTIDPSIVSAEDVEMLQDLIIAAVNDGLKKANKAVQGALSGMMGGLGNLRNMFGT